MKFKIFLALLVCLVSEAWGDDAHSFYLAWKHRYLRSNPQGLYVDIRGDAHDEKAEGGTAGQARSVSEGQGYGMLLTCAWAAENPKAQKEFADLWHFCQVHPSPNNPGLMNWQQLPTPAVKDSSCATDGDMDIAYSLLWAERLWRGHGYGQAGRRRLHSLLTSCYVPSAPALGLGDFIDPSEPKLYWAMRTSDCSPQQCNVFAAATGDKRWKALAEAQLKMLGKLQDPRSGLWPDFATLRPLAPARGKLLETDTDGDFGFNACRVPFRLSLLSAHGPHLPGRYTAPSMAPLWKQAAPMLIKFSRSAARLCGGDPERFSDGYSLAGKPHHQPPSSHQAFSAPLALASGADPAGRQFHDACWTQVSESRLQDDDYYGNTLKALCLTVAAGKWWTAR